jgi:hypothetical protein
MDVGAAFSYMFDDREWVKKIAIGGGIFLGSMILLPVLLIGVLLLFPLFGYMMEALKNVYESRPLPLPVWSNIGRLFKTGFAVFIITLVYNIPALILICAVGSVQALPAMIEMNPEATGTFAITLFCLYTLLFLAFILVNALVPAGLIRYAQFGTLRSTFQFGEVFNFIQANIGDYVITVLLIWVANFIANFGFLLCGIGLVFTFFWSLLVTAHLCGQLAQRVQPAP